MTIATPSSRTHDYGTLKRVRDSVSAGDFFRDAVTLFGGSGHGLEVGVIVDTADGQLVEVFGLLPSGQRVGLRRACAFWEPPRQGQVRWDDAGIVWHTSADGYGPRYAIPSLGTLLDLVAERRLEILGGRA